MIEKRLELLVAADIQSLIDNRVVEDRTIDYKWRLPERRDPNSSEEFCKDATSFANSQGGDLVFGVKSDDNDHFPIEATGWPDGQVRSAIERLEQILKDHVTPRLTNVVLSGF